MKNLLNSGHQVSVWNRTTDKVRDFVEAGAKEALTPSDVIADSDITFSCVADPQAAKELVFGNCGVLQEINTTKVRCRITSILYTYFGLCIKCYLLNTSGNVGTIILEQFQIIYWIQSSIINFISLRFSLLPKLFYLSATSQM